MIPDDLHELARVFVQSGPGLGAALRAAAAIGDMAQVRFLTHRLSGTLGFFDERAAAMASRLELAIVRGGPEDLPAAVEALDREVIRVVGALESSGRAGCAGTPPHTSRSS